MPPILFSLFAFVAFQHQRLRPALIRINVPSPKLNRKAVMAARQTISFLLICALGLMGRAFGADALKGEILAQRWCSTCHVVSSGQQQGTAQAPPFSAIANNPDFNETTTAYFLLTPHPRMPDMNLSRSEATDLAAYIKMQR